MASDIPLIHLQDVYKRFDKVDILIGVSLTVFSGETIVLIGPSGCGKTTILRCVHALEPIDSGMLKVNGIQIFPPIKLDINQYRANIGMVFQQFNLFPHLSVLENLILAPVKVLHIPKDAAIQTAKQLLDRVGMLDKLHSYPDQLSGGQQQRVAIARSLAMSPKILLVDEPTSALDPQMTREVLSVLQDLSHQGMTMLVVTHQISFAERVADRIVYMQNGKIMEEGSPAQIVHAPQHHSTRKFLEDLLV